MEKNVYVKCENIICDLKKNKHRVKQAPMWAGLNYYMYANFTSHESNAVWANRFMQIAS